MAHIVPSDITELALAGASEPELATLARLRNELSGDYVVFHGVHWSREYSGYTAFGEIDFVVVNRAGEVLLIEQKNGPLEEDETGLVKRYESGPKNVNDQVRRAVDSVREKFRWTHPRERLALDYLIYCPEHRVVEINAATLDMSRIVDAASRDSLAQRIDAVLGPGTSERPAWREQVLGFFRQTFDLVPDIHAAVSKQEQRFTRLSSGMARFLADLEMRPLRLRVTGTAGCGKTVVAERFFDRAVNVGARPLLVCFNRPLAERLKGLSRGNGLVTTWYGLCDRFLSERGHKLDYERMRTDPQFWRRVADLVTGETVPEDWRFDTLIVDEGQDFEQEWIEILRLFLRDHHDILWLEDPDQNLHDLQAVRLDGFVRYRARTNYRSPASVAQFIRRVLPFEFEPANDLPGRSVRVTAYDEPGEQVKLVGKIVDELLEQRFDYGDIIVLTTCHVAKPAERRSALDGKERAGKHRLRRFTNEYDLFGNQVLTDGKLRFESVYRFKGQQAPAVILMDVDPAADTLDHDRRVLFSGMTRATVRLEVVARRGNALNTTIVSSWEPRAAMEPTL
jgi:hypothetical protein